MYKILNFKDTRAWKSTYTVTLPHHLHQELGMKREKMSKKIRMKLELD